MANSQNGFPGLESDSDRLHKWIIPGTGRYFVMRNGSAGFLLAHFAHWYHHRIEPIDGGIWDEWGYAYRPVRDGSDLSNHASGTAIDINATRHVLGRDDTLLFKVRHRGKLVVARTRIATKLAVTYRRTIRAGAFYTGRKDEMHYEINASLSMCEVQARRLMRGRRGQLILAANPGQEAVIWS